MGSTWARMQTWDGSKWISSSDWYQADEQIIKPMVKAAAEKYADGQEDATADGRGLPILRLTPQRR